MVAYGGPWVQKAFRLIVNLRILFLYRQIKFRKHKIINCNFNFVCSFCIKTYRWWNEVVGVNENGHFSHVRSARDIQPDNVLEDGILTSGKQTTNKQNI